MRTECIFCEGKNLKPFITLSGMPVFMGTNEKNENEYFSDMNFLECGNCNSIQIKETLDPSMVYMNNHNIKTIGKLWTNHYIEFISFINQDIIDKNILEIGDPSFKLSSKLSSNCKKWLIVELNPDKKLQVPIKTEVLNNFFDDSFVPSTEIDVIIHSHFFEHTINPIGHIKKCYDILKPNGRLIFSVPNLEKILKSGQPINSILNFEHTFYFDEKVLTQFLEYNGFVVDKIKKYENHSIFFSCIKKEKKYGVVKFEKVKSTFINNLNKFKLFVEKVNQECEKHENIFLYGSHVSSQFIINLGLNTKKIKFILDNSEDKQNHKLYGTNLLTKDPTTIKEYKNPLIIVGHMSLYSDEIKQQLEKINSESIFL
jgi:predicted SAM-dependent methyltransferase